MNGRQLRQRLSGYSLVNQVIFPSPSPTYTTNSFPGELCCIRITNPLRNITNLKLPSTPLGKGLETTEFETKAEYEDIYDDVIPCLFIDRRNRRVKEHVDWLMIYCHGNEEDLGLIYNMLGAMGNLIPNMAILAIEFPGYGIFDVGKSTETRVMAIVESIYFWVRETLLFPASRLILGGRSLGTGPATSIAARLGAAGLFLQSPYTSINDVARVHVGDTIADILSPRFVNVQVISKVKCPVLIIHGRRDDIIPVEQSEKLFKACKFRQKFLYLPDEMTHDSFDLRRDVIDILKAWVEILPCPLEDPCEINLDLFDFDFNM